jgi:hypothetical protein
MRGTGVVDAITRSDREELVPIPDRTIYCWSRDACPAGSVPRREPVAADRDGERYGDQNDEPGVHGDPYGT